MKIEKAKKLKIGDIVGYPPDGGKPGGFSKIKYAPENPTVHKNIHGVEYIWVSLECGGMWPSNRLEQL